MATNKELYPLLCTEEEMIDGTAPIVYYKNQAGYLPAYDAGLGFTFAPVVGDSMIPELLAEEIIIKHCECKKPSKSFFSPDYCKKCGKYLW